MVRFLMSSFIYKSKLGHRLQPPNLCHIINGFTIRMTSDLRIGAISIIRNMKFSLKDKTYITKHQ